jgi:hypothetical protein
VHAPRARWPHRFSGRRCARCGERPPCDVRGCDGCTHDPPCHGINAELPGFVARIRAAIRAEAEAPLRARIAELEAADEATMRYAIGDACAFLRMPDAQMDESHPRETEIAHATAGVLERQYLAPAATRIRRLIAARKATPR